MSKDTIGTRVLPQGQPFIEIGENEELGDLKKLKINPVILKMKIK